MQSALRFMSRFISESASFVICCLLTSCTLICIRTVRLISFCFNCGQTGIMDVMETEYLAHLISFCVIVNVSQIYIEVSQMNVSTNTHIDGSTDFDERWLRRRRLVQGIAFRGSHFHQASLRGSKSSKPANFWIHCQILSQYFAFV